MEMLEPKLIHSIAEDLTGLGFSPHSYHYLKDGQTMFGLFLYGRVECARFLKEVGLVGKRRKKLNRFLTPLPQAALARKQPGGG
jgi:hypothetical protein